MTQGSAAATEPLPRQTASVPAHPVVGASHSKGPLLAEPHCQTPRAGPWALCPAPGLWGPDGPGSHVLRD